MSSLTKETKTRIGYRYRASVTGRRISIWIGDVGAKEADGFRRHADAIIEANTAGLPIPRITRDWLDRLPKRERVKLQPLIAISASLKEWIDRYLDSIAQNSAESTIATVDDSLDLLRESFEHERVEAISVESMNNWRDGLLANRQPSTVGKISNHVKAFFAWLVKQRAIDQSPAVELATNRTVGKKEFVTADTIQRVLTHVNDHELKLVIVLARWGGFRIPSEIQTLVRSDVDFRKKRITVRDTKRKTERVIPLFPELVESLTAACSSLSPSDRVLPTIADMPASSIRTYFTLSVKRAGLQPWSRGFHSLRATRETELADRFGLKAASVWIGNSEAVAVESYLLVPDDVFRNATSQNE